MQIPDREQAVVSGLIWFGVEGSVFVWLVLAFHFLFCHNLPICSNRKTTKLNAYGHSDSIQIADISLLFQMSII